MLTMANKLCDGDVQALADDVNSFFCSITEHMDPLEETDFGDVDVPSIYQLTVDQVEESLLSINTTKSPGPDGIPNWVLRDFAGILGSPLCAIWNNTIRSGYIPSIWKAANVAPLPKVKPALAIESDIRPVSLTAIAIKELESFIFKWLWDILRPHIKSDQYGNIRGSSTTMALIELFDAWASASDIQGTQI